MILLPPKLYIDTAHLANIAKVRGNRRLPSEEFRPAYIFIDECIRNFPLGIIFNNVAPLEWVEGRATPKSANEIADVIDSVKLLYLYEGDAEVYTIEILQECLRQNPAIQIPKLLPVFQLASRDGTIESTRRILVKHVPGYLETHNLLPHLKDIKSLPTGIPFISAKDYVAHAFRFSQQNPASIKERIDGYKAALLEDIGNAQPGFTVKRQGMIHWMKKFLRIDIILMALNPGCDIDALLQSIDIERCPAVRLFILARQFRIKAKNEPPKDNDVDDWIFLAAIPYVDLVLTDRNFRNCITKADPGLNPKVKSDPREAAIVLKTLMG